MCDARLSLQRLVALSSDDLDLYIKIRCPRRQSTVSSYGIPPCRLSLFHSEFIHTHTEQYAIMSEPKTGVWPTLKPFVNGGLSGMMATTIIQPIDMVKVRIQLGAEGSPMKVASDIIAKDGADLTNTLLLSELMVAWRTPRTRGRNQPLPPGLAMRLARAFSQNIALS